MAGLAFQYYRGDTIIVNLNVVSGDPSIVSAISAVLQLVNPYNPGGANDGPTAAFSAAFRAATETDPAGWTLTIDNVTSESIPAGNYRAGARLTINGAVFHSDPVVIQISEPVAE